MSCCAMSFSENACKSTELVEVDTIFTGLQSQYSSFLASLWVHQAVMQGRHELAPVSGKQYAACDATGLGSGPGGGEEDL
jgi:hypothetical protein